MVHLGNGLYVSSHTEDKVDGMRDVKQITNIDVTFKEHNGTVQLNEDLDWPDDGVEWNVCPPEWESLESDILDWVTKTL